MGKEGKNVLKGEGKRTERKDHPEVISFRKDTPGMENSPVDLEVKVIYDSAEGDILNQYIVFSKVFTEQYKRYGKSQKTIDETLRICKERNALVEYLENEEVATIMYKFMDQETAMRKALRTERKEGDRLRLERDARGMYRKGISPKDIAEIQDVSVEEIEKILGLEMA